MEEQAPALVVGLGNPGPQYARTRHNAGFQLVDALAQRHGGRFRLESKFRGEICRVGIAGRDLWLLKPLTFMNRSGQAVAQFVNFYRIAPSAMLVVHDDLDLPPGSIRLKSGGGHGGHNGLRDTIHQLGSNEFRRLRLGIGHPGQSRDVVDYVLSVAPPAEQRLLEEAITDAVREFPLLVEAQWEKAMRILHSRRVEPIEAKD
ncbi:MAG: aminoacyl-tRNA hydrolase [Candidatus Competibacteraceae bacterium]